MNEKITINQIHEYIRKNVAGVVSIYKEPKSNFYIIRHKNTVDTFETTCQLKDAGFDVKSNDSEKLFQIAKKNRSICCEFNDVTKAYYERYMINRRI